MALLLVAILFFPIVELLNKAFMSEYKNRINVEAKENRDLALNRITSTLKEASYIYTVNIDIPTESGTSTITPNNNGIAALIPVYDENGDVLRSAGQSLFDAYSYSLIPANEYFDNSTNTDMVLVETYNSFYCDTYADDYSKPTSSCQTDWSESGHSNVIADKAKPGVFLNIVTPFNLKNSDVLEITFAAKKGQIYYPSNTGPTITSKYVHAADIYCRNVDVY